MLKIVEKLKAKARAMFAKKPEAPHATPKDVEAAQVDAYQRPRFVHASYAGGTKRGAHHRVNLPGTKVARKMGGPRGAVYHTGALAKRDTAILWAQCWNATRGQVNRAYKANRTYDEALERGL